MRLRAEFEQRAGVAERTLQEYDDVAGMREIVRRYRELIGERRRVEEQIRRLGG